MVSITPGVRAFLVLTTAVVVAIGIGVGICATQVRPGVRLSAPAHPTSEVMTVSVSENFPVPTREMVSVLREAITLNATAPSVEVLDNTGSVFVDQPRTVLGVSYYPTAGTWTAIRIPRASVEQVLPTDPGNSLDFFRAVAVGPVTNLGQRDVGDIATAGFRARVSLVRIYGLAGPILGGILSATLGLAEEGTRSTSLASPISVWADASGHILRASATITEQGPVTIPANAQRQRTGTITLSDFNGPVRVSAPPADDVHYFPVPRETLVTGTVELESPNGEPSSPRGLLVLNEQVHRPGIADVGPGAPVLVPVPTDGKYTASTLSDPSAVVGGNVVLTATLHTLNGGVFRCRVGNPGPFQRGTTTSHVDVVCDR